MRPRCAAGIALLAACAGAGAPQQPAREVPVATTEALREALATARPGARIVLAPGEYAWFRAAEVKGEAGRPIVVSGASEGEPPVLRGLQLSGVAHLELERLAIVGAPANGLNIDDGGTYDTPSHHVVLREITVRDCGARGNEDGIKLSGVDDFRIERCTVERWGRGGSAVDMVGCHRGLIEGCTFRDRAEDAAATGVQAKGGTRDVAIRACRFEHAGQRAVNAGGSTALAYFRPRAGTFEARDIAIEGCTFVGSEAPIAFVGVDGARVRFNTFYRPRRWFLRILQETRAEGFVPCRNGTFEDNLVAWRADEVATPVNIGPHTAPETFRFARNFWFCIDEPEHSVPRLPVAETDAAGGTDPRFVDAAGGDLRLMEGSPARAHGSGAWSG